MERFLLAVCIGLFSYHAPNLSHVHDIIWGDVAGGDSQVTNTQLVGKSHA